jgi:hypothetical protein
VYWAHQLSTAELILLSTSGAALLGGALFGIAGPRRPLSATAAATAA